MHTYLATTHAHEQTPHAANTFFSSSSNDAYPHLTFDIWKQAIWEHSISKTLLIDLKRLENMACVLVVPASACKTDIKIMVTVLLMRMKFRAICIVQDAVCACFAAVSVDDV
jgi:hypothetical protein